MGVVEKLNTDLTNAIEAFKPINASCISKLDGAISTCTNCVKTKCEARYANIFITIRDYICVNVTYKSVRSATYIRLMVKSVCGDET